VNPNSTSDAPPFADAEPAGWARSAYHEAEEDIRWAKTRASAVTYWTILLFGGIVSLVEVSGRTTGPEHLMAVAAILVASWYWLVSLHVFAAKSRNFVDSVTSLAPGRFRYPEPSARGRDRHHHVHLATQFGLIAGAAALATVHMCGW
jgi:hypothetical protein